MNDLGVSKSLTRSDTPAFLWQVGLSSEEEDILESKLQFIGGPKTSKLFRPLRVCEDRARYQKTGQATIL